MGLNPVLVQNKTFRKVGAVLLPVVWLAGVMNYLDRIALTFAALELNSDLGFSPVDYGIAAGAFSLGYGVGHVPSTFATMRFGARWWYAGMTIAWGIVATCAAAITNRDGLIVQRLLLGLTEAGAVPSAVHLLLQFYPKDMSVKPLTAVTLANVVSVVFAAPLAAGLMSITALGLKGWQWLFILEGIPTVLLGMVMLVVVPNGPRTAWFLTPEEREALHVEVHGSDAEAASKTVTWSQMHVLVWQAAKVPLLWFFAIAGFLWVLCVFSLNSWIAIIVKNMLAGTVITNSTSTGGTSVKNLHATLLSAIPYLTAAIAMWLLACSSHHFREKEFHIGVPWMVGGIVLTFFKPLFNTSFVAGFAVIALAITLAYSSQSVMFARVTESLDRKHAGVGVAIFNAVGASIGGFLGPLVTGAFVQRTGSFVESMVAMGAFLCSSGLMMVGLGIYTTTTQRRRRAGDQGGSAGHRDEAGGGQASDAACINSRTDLLQQSAAQRTDSKDVKMLQDVEMARPNPRAHSLFRL